MWASGGNVTAIALGAAAYTVGTFSLAVLWHIVLFEETYHSLDYFEGEPSFALGLLAILVQGIILSALFPRVMLRGDSLLRGRKFSLLAGAFFWTSHVLAFVAKQSVETSMTFIAMETVYLALQFALFGVLIGVIHREPQAAA